jgi:hypothetical protein
VAAMIWSSVIGVFALGESVNLSFSIYTILESPQIGTFVEHGLDLGQGEHRRRQRVVGDRLEHQALVARQACLDGNALSLKRTLT